MLRVLANYDINAVLEYQKIPFVTMQALVTYDERNLAKEQRFSWEQLGDKKYPKMWVKRIKKNLLELEKQNCKFQIKEIA
jgi:DNA-dependent RNA polymerase auxiliary subunit epsilon